MSAMFIMAYVHPVLFGLLSILASFWSLQRYFSMQVKALFLSTFFKWKRRARLSRAEAPQQQHSCTGMQVLRLPGCAALCPGAHPTQPLPRALSQLTLPQPRLRSSGKIGENNAGSQSREEMVSWPRHQATNHSTFTMIRSAAGKVRSLSPFFQLRKMTLTVGEGLTPTAIAADWPFLPQRWTVKGFGLWSMISMRLSITLL